MTTKLHSVGAAHLVCYGAAVLAAFILGTSAALAGRGIPNHPPIAIDDSQLQVLKLKLAGAKPQPTTRTIPHWWGSTLDPNNGVTYGYNMIGADPYNCAGSACDVTIEVDITPIEVNIDGMIFSGNDVLAALLASPQFAVNDFGSTPNATQGPVSFPTRGPGGPLSQADAGQLLQFQDAVMRAQFNKSGSSNYHVRLHPNILPAVTINVPNKQGVLLQSGRGVIFAAVDYQWWGPQIENLITKADPTHLAYYLTDDLFLYFNNTGNFFCCVLGYHSVKSVGNFTAAQGGGNPPLQTFAWVSWMSPGIYARPNGGFLWHFQDIINSSHEVAEWAGDPFGQNYVEPWFSPRFGCSPVLETGDAVNITGFAKGTNWFRQGPNPNGTQSADGYYHLQDELFLPWFMRLAPNLVSERTQTPSPNVGRYTFMGDLNVFGFNQPATSCPSN